MQHCSKFVECMAATSELATTSMTTANSTIAASSVTSKENIFAKQADKSKQIQELYDENVEIQKQRLESEMEKVIVLGDII